MAVPLKPTVVVNPSAVAVMAVLPLPCRVNCCPVAPTVNAALGVILFVFTPANVGVAPVLIFCIVFTMPVPTLKLVALNCAIPLTDVLASSIVIVPLAPLAFAILTAPVWPLSEVTPAPPGQAAQVGAPAVEIKQSPMPPAATEVIALVP